MLVTINTDASYRSDLQAGAFAFWMVCNGNRLFGAGPLKGQIINSQEAEFKAILNALHYLKDRSTWEGITKVIVNTDNMTCINLINGKWQSRGWSDRVLPHFSRLKAELRVPIEARHVKSHSGKDEKRKYVNDWCDKKAKRALKNFIKNQPK